jgi:NAD(P)H-dependent FMN reductase
MRIALISGSLRANSTNHALLEAAAALLPEGSEAVFVDIEPLPHFNPDFDDDPPGSIAEFRRELAACHALMISSPEYVHSMPGALKDALDWLVSSAELFEKPVITLNASPNAGMRGQEALLHTLEVMSLRVLREDSLVDPFVPKRMARDQILADATVRATLQRSVDALVAAVRDRPD